MKRRTWLALPCAMVALAMGYAAQGLTTKSAQPLQADGLEALVEVPTPASDTLAAAGDSKQSKPSAIVLPCRNQPRGAMWILRYG